MDLSILFRRNLQINSHKLVSDSLFNPWLVNGYMANKSGRGHSMTTTYLASLLNPKNSLKKICVEKGLNCVADIAHYRVQANKQTRLCLNWMI